MHDRQGAPADFVVMAMSPQRFRALTLFRRRNLRACRKSIRRHRVRATLGSNNRRKPSPMYYIALLAGVLSFMALVAALDPAQRRQSRIARRQRD